MNATKRKFNNLLQGLGSSRSKSEDKPVLDASSKTDAQKPPVESDSLTKRRRLGLASSIGADLRRITTSTGSIRKPHTHNAANKDNDGPPARYGPSDRGDLLKRLATFQEITDWTPKPDKVNEIEWAKRGWVCQGKETVRCLLCHKELVVKLNRKTVDGKEVSVLIPSEIEQALVDKYADLIVTSHREDCLWRKRGCEDSLLRLSLASANTALEDLRQRYDELYSRKAFLPYEFNLRLPGDLNLDEVISHLPSDFFTNSGASATDGDTKEVLIRPALALALLGWQGLNNTRIGPVPNSASCHTCLRRLGLWMFKSKEVSEDGEIIVPAPMDSLDPLREHRFFCPWANAEAQKRRVSDADIPGWKILAKTIANEAHLQTVYGGRPRTIAHAASKSVPTTPQRGSTSAAGLEKADSPSITAEAVYLDDEKEREAKDKERWARLRRVKSLFESKGNKKSRRSISRPDTSHSTASNGGSKE